MVPFPVGSMLACQHRIPNQYISREAFESYGLARIEVVIGEVPVMKRIWILAILQLICWEKNITKNEPVNHLQATVFR